MYKKFFLLISVVLTVPFLMAEKNKIVYLVSTPRSLSTVFLRMMESRGDFYIMHEPFLGYFGFKTYPEFCQGLFRENPPTYDKVKNSINKQLSQQHVFVKEMIFAFKDVVDLDENILLDDNVEIILLVRNPHHVICSYYNKIHDKFDAISNRLSTVIDYKSMYELANMIRQKGKNPYIILSEDLYRAPRITVEKMCTCIGIPFRPESLTWDSRGKDFTGHEEWHELKYKEGTHHWHDHAIVSTKFVQPTLYEVDKKGRPTFSEIKNQEHRVVFEKLYQEQLVYYDLLCNEYAQ